MKPTNFSISIDDAIAEGGMSTPAIFNSNPASITDLGSGNVTRMPLPAAPVNPGVASPSDPQWDSSKTNGDWTSK